MGAVPRTYDDLAGQRSTERIAALSDGLFAIAMTLIVLEVHVPSPASVLTDGELARALAELAPRLVTYLLSFLTLGIFWNAQQTQLANLANADRNLTWRHLAFLAAVATMPFSTDLLAEFMAFRTAVLVYWANFLALGLTNYLSWRYAARAGLFREGFTAEDLAVVNRRILVSQTLYAIGTLIGVVASTYLGIAFIVVVQLYYAVGPRLGRLSRALT
jgi:uncharacterized membrane protein